MGVLFGIFLFGCVVVSIVAVGFVFAMAALDPTAVTQSRPEGSTGKGGDVDDA